MSTNQLCVMFKDKATACRLGITAAITMVVQLIE